MHLPHALVSAKKERKKKKEKKRKEKRGTSVRLEERGRREKETGG